MFSFSFGKSELPVKACCTLCVLDVCINFQNRFHFLNFKPNSNMKPKVWQSNQVKVVKAIRKDWYHLWYYEASNYAWDLMEYLSHAPMPAWLFLIPVYAFVCDISLQTLSNMCLDFCPTEQSALFLFFLGGGRVGTGVDVIEWGLCKSFSLVQT